MMERQTRLSPRDMPADERLSGIAPGLIDQERRTRPGLLAWWYRITAPPEPPVSASFKRRDLLPARYASQHSHVRAGVYPYHCGSHWDYWPQPSDPHRRGHADASYCYYRLA
jgi:hypothetical protein